MGQKNWKAFCENFFLSTTFKRHVGQRKSPPPPIAVLHSNFAISDLNRARNSCRLSVPNVFISQFAASLSRLRSKRSDVSVIISFRFLHFRCRIDGAQNNLSKSVWPRRRVASDQPRFNFQLAENFYRRGRPVRLQISFVTKAKYNFNKKR